MKKSRKDAVIVVLAVTGLLAFTPAMYLYPRVMIGGFGVLFGVLGSREVWRGLRCFRWPSVEGRILRAEIIQRASGSDSNEADHPQVSYVYSVGGREYRGTRISMGSGAGGTLYSRWALRGLASGKSVRVYPDPQDPAVAVLRPGPPASGILLLMGGVLCLIGSFLTGPHE